ncbi:MAG: topoisomerase C-terminal repeat-containing protein, partial [Caldiserica bacterium]|nr:topoisomerase C-terminal repeat-containing protein [Caldisericota bacterium]
VLERPASYVCEHHGRKKTDCKFSIPKMILRRSITREEALQLMTEKRTDMLDGFVSKRGFKFSARLLLKPDNKLEWEFAEGSGGGSAATEPVVNEEPLGRCPVCQGSVVETTEHYRCTVADCRFQMKRVYAGKTIDRDMARNLLEHGKTELIEDFVSKYNRPFSAYLKLGDKGRVEFEFLNKGPRTGKRATGHMTKAVTSATKTTKTGKTGTSAKKAAPKTSNSKGGVS